jgi:hypothetical protein
VSRQWREFSEKKYKKGYLQKSKKICIIISNNKKGGQNANFRTYLQRPDDNSQRGSKGFEPAAFREGNHCGRRQSGNPSTVKGKPP